MALEEEDASGTCVPRHLVPAPNPWAPCKKNPLRGFCATEGTLRKRIGGALLSRAPERSIIAAVGLNGRVREGNGCFTDANATNPKGRIWMPTEVRVQDRLPRGSPGMRSEPLPYSIRFASLSTPGPWGTRCGGGAGKPHGLSEPVS